MKIKLFILALLASSMAHAASNAEIDQRIEQLLDFGAWLETLKAVEPVPEPEPEPEPVPEPEAEAEPEPNPEPSDMAWQQLPNTSQDTIFVPGVDDAQYPGAWGSWKMIQGAWSGAVCANDKLYIHGGGHADSWHNGVLAVDPKTGQWERITEPSPVYPPNDPRCPKENCWTGPDGNPVSRHTYNLLASDGENIYIVGGAKWHSGTGGGDDANWRFNPATKQWSTFPVSGIEKAHGNLVYADGKLYYVSGSGHRIYDIATTAWAKPGNKAGFGGDKVMVYEPVNDVFVVVGDGYAKVTPRNQFGKSWADIPNQPAAVDGKHLGVTVKDGKVLIWPNQGPTIHTYDPATNTWGEITPAGNPGTSTSTGTFGRFSYCAGELVLVNGHDVDLWQVREGVASEPVPAPEPIPAPAPIPTPEPETNPAPASEILEYPYYATPPVNIAQDVCGPHDQWGALDVRTDEDIASVKRLKEGTRTVVNVHWRAAPYPTLYNKTATCVKYVGLPGPQGQRPVVAGVNATKSWKAPLRAGGIEIENLRLSQSDYVKAGGTAGGDCIGIPNNQQYVIIRDSDISGCGHHALITSRAYNLYLEIDNSHFEYASSHLAYIDQVAMAYIHDSTFSSPGWGHALRCISARCVIENVMVSNVELDGTIAPDGVNVLHPTRTYIGMHPLDLYLCGENEGKNINVIFNRRNGSVFHASAFRSRKIFNTCNLGGHDEKEWVYAPYGSDAWHAGAYKTPITWDIDGLRVQCVGEPCYGTSVGSSYPIMHDKHIQPIKDWNKANSFETWEAVMDNVPDPAWKWTLSRFFPEYRQTFLNQDYRSGWPLEVPQDWQERATVTLKNFTVSDPRDGLMLSPSREAWFCFGHFGECGTSQPAANVTIN